MTTAKKRAAKKPETRTVTVTMTGDYEGWTMTARADFPARVLVDLQSESIERITGALDRIVIEHNFPDADGEVAATMADVDPFGGVVQSASSLFEAIGKLPNR